MPSTTGLMEEEAPRIHRPVTGGVAEEWGLETLGPTRKYL
jgi:hypothetical protein